MPDLCSLVAYETVDKLRIGRVGAIFRPNEFNRGERVNIALNLER
jgi:hypothetical protein